jgi:flagellar basal-body rod protein FlgF
MLYGLYISAAGLRVNQYRMETQSNNLANVATAGFKPDSVVVQSRPAATDRMGGGGPMVPDLARMGGGVWARQSFTCMRAGPLEPTNQPLDVALDTGPTANGFLTVRGEGGAQYTRDGRLAMDSAGRLLTQASRLEVLDDAGSPIRLDPGAGAVHIDRSGVIRQGGQVTGKLGLAGFEHPERLVQEGEGRWMAPPTEAPGEFDGQVLQGFVEGSAVEPANMLARMIQTQRLYEANANMIRYQDQTLGRAVNDIARIA